MDSRFFRRRSIAIHFRVFDDASGAFVGRVGDISEGGLLVYGPNRLGVGRLFRLRIDLPPEGEEQGAVTLDARTMWSGADVNPEFFCSGLRFYELDKPSNRQALDRLLTRFTVSTEEERDEEN